MLQSKWRSILKEAFHQKCNLLLNSRPNERHIRLSAQLVSCIMQRLCKPAIQHMSSGDG